MVKNRFVTQKLGKRVSRRQELAKSKIQLERKIRPERGLSKSSRRGA